MGRNLALNADITASSYIEPYTPDRAVNGIVSEPTSRWLCAAIPGWLCVDLKKSCWIGQWTVKSIGGNAGWPVNYCMTSFCLDSSIDGNNWKTVDTVFGNIDNNCTRMLSIPVCARYFRVITYNDGGLQANKSVASVMELELIEKEVSVLTSLIIKDKEEHTATLTPVFHSDTLSYTTNVGYDSERITVIPVASTTNAAITVNGLELIEGKASVDLITGSNKIEIKVTSPDNYTVTYLVTVTRASSPYMTSVKFTGIRFSGFVKTTYNYNLSAGTLTTTAVTPTTEDSEAVVVITLNGVVYNKGQSIPLSIGDNPINIAVTSKTGVDNRIYVFKVNKKN